MPDLQDVREMYRAIHRHLHPHLGGHSNANIVNEYDAVPTGHRIWYICTDCATGETVWTSSTSSIRSPNELNDRLRESMRTAQGRDSLIEVLRQYPDIRDVPFLYPPRLTPEVEEEQLRQLWGLPELEARVAYEEQVTREARAQFEGRIHDRIPTRFEREDVI
jgi:hypothetical protein